MTPAERELRTAPDTHAITVLFDGQCPLCSREMRMIRRWDRLGRVGTIDITGPDFDPARFGLTHHAVMARIHGILPDGRVVEGMEVFRRIYRALGRGWIVAWTGWPVLKPIADVAYILFARNRLRLTGRCGDNACRAPR